MTLLASVPAPAFDIERVLASNDTMAAQRPVAARIVSVANSDDTSAKKLSRILATDLALTWSTSTTSTRLAAACCARPTRSPPGWSPRSTSQCRSAG